MYLIVKCDELGDAWECDANRTPICMTDDYSSYGIGYEVYKVLADNTFEKIKDYEEGLETGIAVYYWKDDDTDSPPIVCEKWSHLNRNKCTKSFLKKIKAKYKFTDTIYNIYDNIQCCGGYGEEIKGDWFVIGEYTDNRFSSGY